jgi:predicted PhzF superfamily epimerase YddE/YHI9
MRRRAGPHSPRCRAARLRGAELVARIARALALSTGEILGHQWVDNGPGWSAVRLASAEAVLALRPDWAALHDIKLGVVGSHPEGADAQFEVRALIGEGAGYEDPVTGSLNASLAQWLIGSGVAPPAYVAAQGALLDRRGRVFIDRVDGQVWVGGSSVSCIRGELVL